MNARRVHLPIGVRLIPQCVDCARRTLDTFAYARICAAAADVAGHREIDVGIARSWIAFEQSGGRHDLTRLAVAALRHLFIDPGLLYGVQSGISVVHAFDGRALLPDSRRCRRHTGTYGRAVHVHGACAALCDATAEFCAGQADVIADDPQQRGRRIDIDRMRLAIDAK